MLYLATVCPTIYFQDSPEFINTAYAWGISHPAGFPFYNLIAKLPAFLPFGSIALKVNLFSAFFSCLTLASLLVACKVLTEILFGEEEASGWMPLGAGMVPVVCLAFSKPFWMQSILAEVYTLHSFLTILIFTLLFYWKKNNDFRYLFSAAFIYGLSAGNHATVAFYLPAILVLFFAWKESLPEKANPAKGQQSESSESTSISKTIKILSGAGTWRNLGACVLLFLLGLSVFLYLPVRSLTEPSFDWGNPETFQGFFFQVSDQKDKETHFSNFRTNKNQPPRGEPDAGFALNKLGQMGIKFGKVFGGLMKDLSQQVSLLVSIGLILGGCLCFCKSKPLFVFFFIIVGVNATFFTNWKQESYFPSYLVACLLSSQALFVLLRLLAKSKLGNRNPDNYQRLMKTGLVLFILILIPSKILANYKQVNRSEHYAAETLSQKVFLSVPDNALFVSGITWFQYFYFKDVVRLRDDIVGVPAWDLLYHNSLEWLTPKRYPSLKWPQSGKLPFESREEIALFDQELFKLNSDLRPVVIEQNHSFLRETGLTSDFQPINNVLLAFSNTSDEIDSARSTKSFQEFKRFLQEDINQRGHDADLFWLYFPQFFINSFEFYFHETKNFSAEREVLHLTREFLNRKGPRWQFKMFDNLILDGKTDQARPHLETLKQQLPDHYLSWLAEGLIHRVDNKFVDALLYFQRARQSHPEKVRPYIELAITYYFLKEKEKALKELTDAASKVQNLWEIQRVRKVKKAITAGLS